jgi:methylamine dehydrogenase accessory protein MauD
MMGLWGSVSHVFLWLGFLALAFLILGALRSLALLRWRLEQLEAVTPTRIGRGGLNPGKPAPDFTLPAVAGGEVSLRDFAGRRVFLVFTQSGCKPCHRIVSDLNRLQRNRALQVLVVNNGEPAKMRATFPVLLQQQFVVSKRYEMYATPFAFLIDERGIILSKGVINNSEHIAFVLRAGEDASEDGQGKAEPAEAGMVSDIVPFAKGGH